MLWALISNWFLHLCNSEREREGERERERERERATSLIQGKVGPAVASKTFLNFCLTHFYLFIFF